MTGDGNSMSSTARYGFWVVYLGAALQLIGIGWDAFRARGPGDGLVIAGIGMVLVGIVWGLWAGYRPLASGGFGVPIALAALFVLVVGSATILVTSEDGPTDEIGSAEDDVASSGNDDQDLGDLEEVWAQLLEATRDGGTPVALERLHGLASSDEDVQMAAHALALRLGRHSFTFYAGASVAFSFCREDFGSACYHGVLEAYLARNPDFTGEDLRDLCSSAGVSGGTDLEFQCFEGLGHALSLHFEHNLIQALHYCDLMATPYARSTCHGGAFRENIRLAEAPDPTDPDPAKPALAFEDPLYPCNAVAEKYQPTCYELQPAAILFFNGQNFAAGFVSCDGAPSDLVATCYRGMGRYIAARAGGDDVAAKTLCKQGRARFWDACFAGLRDGSG